ncbi:MAG: hypothetical protein P8Z36_14745 [Gemmatimonadota bacterium]
MKQIGLALGVALIGALAACGGGGGNGAGNASTFIQFQTDGGFDKPNMSLIFHLFLDDPAAIAGRTVDYHDVPDDMRIPLAVFELGDDVSVTQRLDQSSFTIMFGQVQDGIISGSFSGDGFVVGALHSEGMRPTNLTGANRARLLRE